SALKKLDFDKDPATRSEALAATLSNARTRDTLTLWHLLPRVNEGERVLVYEKMQSLALPPAGVTREGVLRLDQNMLDVWRDSLLPSWQLGSDGKGNPKNLKDMKSLKVWPDFKSKDPV